MTGLLMKQEREWFWKEFAAMQSKNYSRIFPEKLNEKSQSVYTVFQSRIEPGMSQIRV